MKSKKKISDKKKVVNRSPKRGPGKVGKQPQAGFFGFSTQSCSGLQFSKMTFYLFFYFYRYRSINGGGPKQIQQKKGPNRSPALGPSWGRTPAAKAPQPSLSALFIPFILSVLFYTSTIYTPVLIKVKK